MLFKYIEEVNMPSLMHCVQCDKPGILSDGLCNNCYEIKKEDEVPVITGYKDTDALLEDERISQEDEPTTADKYNKEWLHEKR